ncbi:MAG: hypothetical protein HYS09_10120 [Chloroflexi bacterium]|nr:hypothetical protein [Chloroflexota bacterium]
MSREKEVTMATELTSRSWFSRLDKWWIPFLWLILTPIVTVPLSAGLFELLGGYHEPQAVGLSDRCGYSWFCATEYSEARATVMAFALPGLLGLAPFLWAASSKARVSSAGIVAGFLGTAQAWLPVLVLYLSFDRVTGDDGRTYFLHSGWVESSAHSVVWFFGFVAWLASLVGWWLFGRLTRGSGREMILSIPAGIGGAALLTLAVFGLYLNGHGGDVPGFIIWPLAAVGAAGLWFSYRSLAKRNPEHPVDSDKGGQP